MKISNLSKEISKRLKEYTNEVEKGLEKAKEEVAKDAVKTLKKTSPKKTGDYRKGWSKKKVGSTVIIHNRTNYQLTHLLENGHAKVGGGRVAPRVHIRPVEEKTIKEFIEATEKVIKK